MEKESQDLLTVARGYARIRNREKAIEYYKKAILKGERNIQKEFYDILKAAYDDSKAKMDKRTVKKYKSLFSLLSQEGYGMATVILGEIAEDYEMSGQTAISNYRLAWEQGEKEGIIRVCRMGVKIIDSQPEIKNVLIEWMDLAMEEGFLEAYYLRGRMLAVLDRPFFEYTFQLDSEGNRLAEMLTPQYGVGFKNNVIVNNGKEALSWYLRGALLGEINCIRSAGDYFLVGRGTKRDEKKAVELYKQGAEKGDSECCLRLASYYGFLKSDGGMKSEGFEKMEYWMDKAKELGDPNVFFLKERIMNYWTRKGY